MRLLTALMILSLAACDQSDQTSHKNPQVESPEDELHQTISGELPPITFDLEKDAAPFLIAFADHANKPFEGQDDFYELVLKAERIDSKATLNVLKERKPVPFICGSGLPEIQSFVKMLEEDEELQLLSAFIIDPTKDQEKRSRPVLQKAREILLKTRLEEFIKRLGPTESYFLEINKKLKAIIDGK